MSRARLHGRAEQLELVREVAGAVDADATARLVVVRGEAGVGKTALLDEIAGTLDGTWTVVRVGSTEIETDLAWAGLHGLTGSADPEHLARLPAPQLRAIEGALGASSEPVDAALVAFGLAELMRVIARTRPLALIVDDGHWLDRSSAAALSFALRTTSTERVLGIVAMRTDTDPVLEVERVLPADRLTSLRLEGLSPPGLHRLLSDRCGVALGRPDLIRLHDATRGIPLHALEVGRIMAGGRTLSDALSTATVQGTIARRLATVPADTIAVLQAVALLRRPTVERIRCALPELAERTVIAVADAERAGLVARRGDAVELAHPLFRTALVDGMSTAERRRLAIALAAVVDDADERIGLLVLASDGEDAELADGFAAAAERSAAAGALAEAADQARRAAELTPESQRRTRGLRLVRAAELAANAGDRNAPLALATEAERWLDDDDEAEFRLTVVRILALGNGGAMDAAVELAERAAAELGDDSGRRARILDLLTQALSFSDFERAAQAAEQAVAAARCAGDASTVRLELLHARLRMVTGEFVDLDALPLPGEHDLLALAFAGDLLTWSDRHAHALDVHGRVLAAARASGMVDREMVAHDQLFDTYLRLGRCAEAERHLQEWFDLNQVIGGPAAQPRVADLAVLSAHRGDADESRRLIADVSSGASTPSDELHLRSRACTVGVALGDWQSAVDEGRRALAAAEALGSRDVGAVGFHADLVEALVHVGAVDEAAAVTELFAMRAAHQRLEQRMAMAERCRALVLGAGGDVAGAVEHATGSVAILTDPCLADRVSPFERARSQLVAGAAMRRYGRRSEASELLEAALDGFRSLAVPGWVARARAELDRLGARRATDPTALTPTETQIARLVVDGRTNAEVAAELSVSVRTVESNLTRAYRKLGVRSRTELAARLRAAEGVA